LLSKGWITGLHHHQHSTTNPQQQNTDHQPLLQAEWMTGLPARTLAVCSRTPSSRSRASPPRPGSLVLSVVVVVDLEVGAQTLEVLLKL